MSMAQESGCERQVKTWHCGTLTYTKAGLAMLFLWLLWGDFCYTLMEAVVPSILPLKLKDLGAPNWLIGVIMTTGPGLLNMTVCPWVSFKSDRYRSKWGRRIPFIILTMPFLCVFLGLLGWSDEISALLQAAAPALRAHAPATITIGVIAILLIGFQLFNMFVASVFCCLFNDVVPPQFIGRIMGAIRFISIGAGALYNWYVFKYAESHMREIFTGTALLYLVGFGLVCLFLKEGEYPPIEGEADKDNKGWGGIRTFFKESFTHRFYWFRFISTGFAAIAASIGFFSVFFQREMGLDLEQIGKTVAVSSMATMVAILFMATFVDRWHPLRLSVYSGIFNVIGNLILGVWLFVTLPGAYYFWLGLGGVLAGTLLNALLGAAALPCEMKIFPQSRFGQFCSAQSLIRSSCTAVSGIMAGAFIDLMKWLCHGSDYAYRFNFLWMTVFSALSAFFLVLVYIEWNRMGGDRRFHPPAPWSPSGVEEMPITPFIGPQTRWLRIAFLSFDAIMALTTLCTPVMAWWMYMRNEIFAAWCHFALILPLSVVAWLCWGFLKSAILRDMDAARNGTPLANGIPHHGMLILIGVKFFILAAIWLAEVWVTVSMDMQGGAVAFGVTRVVANLLLVAAVWLICRIERGFSNEIDVKALEAKA